MASTDSQFISLDFLPGFHRESTEYSEEGKWYDGNRVRFRQGKPENMRGYQKFTDTTINGVARDILTWTDNNTRKYIGLGTPNQLYVIQGEEAYDVTPITTVVSTNNSNLITTNATTKLKVDLGFSHSVSVNDRVEFTSVAAFNNISVNGTYAVVSVSGTDAFYVSLASVANASGAGGGLNGKINLLLENETADNIQGLGYGAGDYNAGTGNGRTWNTAATESSIIFQANQWKLDTFGEDFLAHRRGGIIYVLDTDASTTPQRTVATSSPVANTFIVSPNDRHVICYGTKSITASAGAPIDPLLLRWSDQNNYDEWTPAATNTSGDAILTEGTRIVGAHRSRNAINIWTDKAMYTQSFVGPPFVFQFTQVGSNCGLIGPHAAVDIDGVAYWMGDNNFYMYDGRVQTMPCTIRRHLFDSFNMTQKDKVYAGVNSEFKEIIWLYPDDTDNEPNSYVIYNYEELTWVYGRLFDETGITTVFADRDIYDTTLMVGKTSVGSDTFLWRNEPPGIYKGDGKTLSSFIESAAFDLDRGKELMYADKIIPDYTFTPGEEIKFQVKVREYPSSDFKEKGPYTINQNTRKVNIRARGRQATVKVSANANGTWRWGSVRMAVQPDGER
jgi:hypothetical protein